MAIRKIRSDTDPRLRKVSRAVESVDEKIKLLLEDMVETMYKAEGVGLAAPQIGIMRRVVVVDIGDGIIYKMINPEIKEKDGEQIGMEGCLSVPNKTGVVKRPQKIKVDYLDENGDQKSIEAEDFLARAICHEVDHINGILYVDIAEEVYEYEDEAKEQ